MVEDANAVIFTFGSYRLGVSKNFVYFCYFKIRKVFRLLASPIMHVSDPPHSWRQESACIFMMCTCIKYFIDSLFTFLYMGLWVQMKVVGYEKYIIGMKNMLLMALV